jgi:cell division protein FtsL
MAGFLLAVMVIAVVAATIVQVWVNKIAIDQEAEATGEYIDASEERIDNLEKAVNDLGAEVFKKKTQKAKQSRTELS